MWYTKEVESVTLDQDKPIIAEDSVTEVQYLLLPQIDKIYNVIGFNWFNLSTGVYASSMAFATVDIAVAAWCGRYLIYNACIHIMRDEC